MLQLFYIILQHPQVVTQKERSRCWKFSAACCSMGYHCCLGVRETTKDGQIFDHVEVSINGSTPIAGWFIRENPIKVDDD